MPSQTVTVCQVIGFVSGPRPHALAHGRDLMNRLAASLKLPEAKRMVSGQKRALGLQDLGFIQVTEAPTSDVVCLKDIPVDSSCWRFGLNRPLPANYEELMSTLVQQELQQQELTLQQSPDGQAARLHQWRPNILMLHL